MARIELSALTANGQRIGALFAKALDDLECASEDWTLREDGEGVHVRLIAATGADDALFVGLDELRVGGISDHELTNRIREYQDTILSRQG